MTKMRAVRLSHEELRAAGSEAELREMAVLSYTHRIPAIRWLFWRRLDTALRLARLKQGEVALDFGCGTGILLPSLARVCRKVYATDLLTDPARALARRRGLANVVFVDDPGRIGVSTSHELDCAFALDVLEHVADLAGTLGTLAQTLRPGGRLVVSGPTETVFYRAGRMVAGFRNEYHERSIREILAVALETGWALREYAREPAFPLPRAFEIYALTRRLIADGQFVQAPAGQA